MNNYYRLKNNTILGIRAVEISTFPDELTWSDRQSESMKNYVQYSEQLLSEFHKLASRNTCAEFLWVTEEAENQTFSSRIRIFCILRTVAGSENLAKQELDNIMKHFTSTFSTLRFEISSEGASEDIERLVSGIDDSCVLSLVKKERFDISPISQSPYYYCDIIPENNTSNFSMLVSSMSQLKNCALSLQLMPTAFSAPEQELISTAKLQYRQYMSGAYMGSSMYKDDMARDPYRVMDYYESHQQDALFKYNILAFGSENSCKVMLTRFISHLQAGDSVVSDDFTALNLTPERISLARSFVNYPWTVNDILQRKYRNTRIFQAFPYLQGFARMPYLLTGNEAVSFFRLPVHEKNMAALKDNKQFKSFEQFSDSVIDKNNIQLGELISGGNGSISIGCPPKIFTKHALIVGTPGSGKTTFSINLLLQFYKKGVPFLAIEPTKSEYRSMIEAIPEIRVFTPGNNKVSPFIINPFIPPKGITVEQYIPSLSSAFNAAFSMPSPLDMIFLKAIRESYTHYGWKDYSTSEDPNATVFGLYEFIQVFKKIVASTNYSREIRGNIESAGIFRLTNLIEQNSNIYDTINTVPIEDLLSCPTVLELNSIDNAEQKSLIMALLLINICVYTKHNQVGEGKLKNAILIDEAHVLLGGHSSNAGAASQDMTVKALQDMIAEIRSYGTSIIIADQSPTQVSNAVIANTEVKVSFRLVQSQEKALIADSTNMNDEDEAKLSKLHPGEAYVYYSLLDLPQLVYTPDIREKEGIRINVPDEEIAEKNTYWNDHKELLKPHKLCRYASTCPETCDFKVRADAQYLAQKVYAKVSKKLKDKDYYKSITYNIAKLLKNDFLSYDETVRERLIQCTKIKFMHKVELDTQLSLSLKEKVMIIRNNNAVSEEDEQE